MIGRKAIRAVILGVALPAFVVSAGCGIRITSPEDGTQFKHGETVTLKGKRKLGASSIHDFEWRSSLDGYLGDGDVLLVPETMPARPPLSVGEHTIEAKHPGPFIWITWKKSVSITVTGYPISLDPRMLGSGTIDIVHDATGHVIFRNLGTDDVHDLHVGPGSYTLKWMGKSLTFDVSAPPATCVATTAAPCCGLVSLP